MNIIKYLMEADDDDNATAAAGDDTAGENPAGNEADEENVDAGDADDAGGGSDDINDDDFSMDSDLGDDNGDDSSGGDSGGSSSFGGSGDEENTDEEVKQQNADMFTSLSAEEQKIKILELKKLYLELYTNCDDILKRIDEFPVDEDTIDIVSRISAAMFRIKKEMEDYLQLRFPNATYYENDVAYNRFLYFYDSVAKIIEDTAKFRQKLVGNDDETEK